MLEIQPYITRLEAGMHTIEALVRGVPESQARWKPSPGEWSLVEVINHLYDEERDDFRYRIEQTLHHPEQPLAPIDPEGWAIQRRYNERHIEESLLRFLSVRLSSLAFLRQLGDKPWDQLVNHPQLSGLRAGDLLVSWAAHDMLHIRQLNQLHWHYLQAQAVPYRLDYAGEW
ncbi:MAG: DinB family protein [Roseiflexaceae bacterium]|nr:DinB family protein [Roseiflexaceae bacterium]